MPTPEHGNTANSRETPAPRSILYSGVGAGLRQARWLLSILVPVSFGVFLLQELGILVLISGALTPLFEGIGLSGVGALGFVAGVITNPYTVVAIIGTAGLPVREIAILSIMCLIAHNFPVELAILRRTGSSVLRMFFLRLTSALIAGLSLNLLMPEGGGLEADGSPPAAAESVLGAAASLSEFGDGVFEWFISTAHLAATILAILTALMVLVHFLRAYGVIERIASTLTPLMRVFGLPGTTSFLWLICNLLGLSYGAAVLLEEEQTGRLRPADGDLLNHHVAVSHSMLEDTMIFVAVGAPLLWISIPRLLLALAAVWLRRGEMRLRGA
ncbi:MAG: nucleoside recognition domain-containing protein [Spirochaetales bacterium]